MLSSHVSKITVKGPIKLLRVRFLCRLRLLTPLHTQAPTNVACQTWGLVQKKNQSSDLNQYSVNKQQHYSFEMVGSGSAGLLQSSFHILGMFHTAFRCAAGQSGIEKAGPLRMSACRAFRVVVFDVLVDALLAEVVRARPDPRSFQKLQANGTHNLLYNLCKLLIQYSYLSRRNHLLYEE